MSSCDVCLEGFDGTAEFFYEHEVTARQAHKCSECRQEIPPKQKYMRIGGKWEGLAWHVKVCLCCYEINTVFSCGNGTIWGGEMWGDMCEQVFPELTVSSPCFNKLSVTARLFLTEHWWKWKEQQIA